MNSILARDSKHLFLEGTVNEGNSFVADVNILVNNLDVVTIAAEHIANIDTVATHINAVDTVAHNIDVVVNVNDHIDDILLSNAHLQYIIPVSENIASVITNANNIDAITACGNSIDSIVKVASENIPQLAEQIHADMISVNEDKTVVQRLRNETAADRQVVEQKTDIAIAQADKAALERQLAEQAAQNATDSATVATQMKDICVSKADEVAENTEIVLVNTDYARIYSHNANISKEEAKAHADRAEAERLLTDKNLHDTELLHNEVVAKHAEVDELHEDTYALREECAWYREKARLSEYYSGNYFRQCEYLAFYSKDYHDRALELTEQARDDTNNKLAEIHNLRDEVVDNALRAEESATQAKVSEETSLVYRDETTANREAVEQHKTDISNLNDLINEKFAAFEAKVASLEATIQEYEEEYEYRKNSGFVAWLDYKLTMANDAVINLLQTKHFVVLRNHLRSDLEKFNLTFCQQMAENDLTNLIQSKRIGIKKHDPTPLGYFDDMADGDDPITGATNIGLGNMFFEPDDGGDVISLDGSVVTP